MTTCTPSAAQCFKTISQPPSQSVCQSVGLVHDTKYRRLHFKHPQMALKSIVVMQADDNSSQLTLGLLQSNAATYKCSERLLRLVAESTLMEGLG